MKLIDSHEFKHQQFFSACPMRFIGSLAVGGLNPSRYFVMQLNKGDLKTQRKGITMIPFNWNSPLITLSQLRKDK